MDWRRTHTCGELNLDNRGESVVLNGWVDVRRDLGGVIFIELRDRYGHTQVVFKQESGDLHAQAEELRSEYVVAVKGVVSERDDETVNPRMATGKVEVEALELKIWSKADTPPFEIRD
ncbi:MAG: OB-fold nucleic acid binding domain-containing protein, partial [Balneolaceae bacterium]